MNAFKKIIFKGHPVLGDLNLDFCNKNGATAKTIILVGENGSGKSKILEALYQCTTGKLKFGCDVEITNLKNPQVARKLSFECGDQDKIYVYDETGDGGPLETDPDENYYLFPAIFSEASLISNENQIDTVSGQLTDASDLSRRTGTGYVAQIKQILVDIAHYDALNLLEAYRDRKVGIGALDNINIDLKMDRFTNAFDKIFEDLKFSTIENVRSYKDILFKKADKEISIDNLSSGEKQVIYRGCFLLQDRNALKGAVVFLDEPELSMHPKWQQKILQYYRGLFPQNGEQTTQMFIATHSEYVLKAALEYNKNNNNHDDDILIIPLTNEDGTIKLGEKLKDSVFESPTFAETNYLIFDIISTDYHNELYGNLQKLTCRHKISECEAYILDAEPFKRRGEPKRDSKVKFDCKNGYEDITETLPTFVRNAIDHPDGGREFEDRDSDIRKSIDLLRELCFEARKAKEQNNQIPKDDGLLPVK